MLTAAVIDDEPRSRDDLARRLAESGQCRVLFATSDPVAGLTRAQTEKPQVMLLDVEMPDLDGLTLARDLPPMTAVVFVSAHASHAVSAFEVAAVDYLLKPVSQKRFSRMIARVQERLSASAAAPEPTSDALLRLETRRGLVLCPETEILSVFAEGDMSRVLLRGDRQIYCLRPLKHFEGMLVSGCHHRIDRFTILNVEAVRELRPMAGARGAVVLSDSEQVMTIGRAGTSRLRQLLANRTPSRTP